MKAQAVYCCWQVPGKADCWKCCLRWVPDPETVLPQRLAESGSVSRQKLLQTLLFMPIADVYRPYALRSYSGDALSLLSERDRAFGYVHTERFLSQLAHANAHEHSATVLLSWIANLWNHDDTTVYYVDGHRKPVYSDVRLPRGLIGRTGRILEARALTLLHDEQGHPLAVTTERGDQHLTLGLPQVMAAYETLLPDDARPCVVVDRECMAANFLQDWHDHYTFVTLLKSNQYQGLASFSQIGEFIPLVTDATGRVCQDVAPARFALNIPDQDAPLDLYVALIRYHRRSLLSEIEALPKQTVKPSKRSFTDADWQPHPEPAAPVVPRLIPIVCTREIADPVTLVSLYRHRWTAQENVIKDFLLPLGLDVNHGYAKQQIENSEFRKQYDALQDKARCLDRWRKSALRRMKQASNRHDRLRQALTDFSTTHYQQLNDQETTCTRSSLITIPGWLS